MYSRYVEVIRSMISLARTKYIYYSIGIAISASLPAWSQDIDHSLGPIKQAQSSDPAGFQLMIFCIGLLVFMVLGLFTGTMFYFMQGKKNKSYSQKSDASVEDKVSTE